MVYKARPKTRAMISNQITQTSALAAFIAGFAYTSLEEHSADVLSIVRYVMTVKSVHCCMCSTISSAILYQILESLHDDDFENWTNKPMNKIIMKVPSITFGLGCIVFLITVILKSWYDLGSYNQTLFQYCTLGMGILSVSMMSGIFVWVHYGGGKVGDGNGNETSYGEEKRVIPTN